MNRITKVNIGWALIIAVGIGSFVAAKGAVEKQRLHHMKIRERMRNANTGEYEASSRKFE